jgi:hypothetical protein
MRDALIEKGVPTDRIYLDYAGFRTLDSVVRAKEIFGQIQNIVGKPDAIDRGNEGIRQFAGQFARFSRPQPTFGLYLFCAALDK